MFNISRPQPPGCPAGQVLMGNRAGALRGLEPGGRARRWRRWGRSPPTRSLTHLFAHLAAGCGPGRQSGDSTRPGRQGCGWETGVRPGGQGGGASGQRALGLKFPEWGRQAQPTPSQPGSAVATASLPVTGPPGTSCARCSRQRSGRRWGDRLRASNAGSRKSNQSIDSSGLMF